MHAVPAFIPWGYPASGRITLAAISKTSKTEINVRSSIVDLLEYFVKLKLAYPVLADALYDYFVKNESPSMIAEKYGISRNVLRGRIQRIYEYASPRRGTLSNIVKLVAEAVKDIEPVYTRNDWFALCNLCNHAMFADPSVMMDHLVKVHKSYVEYHVEKALNSLIARVAKTRNNGENGTGSESSNE